MDGRKLPAPGSFFRPVGHVYGYCLEFVEVKTPTRGGTHWVNVWTMRRWGMTDDQQPVDDGHINIECDDFIPISDAKVLKCRHWARDTSYGHGPRYYRQIDVKGQQQSLF